MSLISFKNKATLLAILQQGYVVLTDAKLLLRRAGTPTTIGIAIPDNVSAGVLDTIMQTYKYGTKEILDEAAKNHFEDIEQRYCSPESTSDLEGTAQLIAATERINEKTLASLIKAGFREGRAVHREVWCAGGAALYGAGGSLYSFHFAIAWLCRACGGCGGHARRRRRRRGAPPARLRRRPGPTRPPPYSTATVKCV